MNLKKTVGGFVGANSFALIMVYVRMNSHLRVQPNNTRPWGFFRQLLFPGVKHLPVIPLLLTALPAAGAGFTVLHPQQSSITFVSTQMGVPVEGSFRKFTARIAVDPARPEAGTARIDIDLTSIDTGIVEADEEVAGKKWFDTQNHPIASFTSAGVGQSGKGRYEALGKLTIKGKSLDIKAPFTLKQNADTLVIDGVFPLRRLDYAIGTGIWSDTEVVADEVRIHFHFTFTK